MVNLLLFSQSTGGKRCKVDVTLAKVQPLLTRAPSEAQRPRVEGWIAALSVLLNRRYGVALAVDLEPLVLVVVADAVQRRLDKTKQMIDSEAAGPFSARWNPASSLGAWFLPAELADLDSLTGSSGTRTYRTPAPDHVRFVNRLESYEPESDLEEIANEAIGEPYVS